MRFLAILLAIPALAQQGQVDERVLQNAMRDALLNGLKASPVTPAPNLPLRNPLPNLPLLRNPLVIVQGTACAVPLRPVPIQDVDKRIVQQPRSADEKMIVTPVPVCR